MTHKYIIEGMTCPGCAVKVKSALLSLPDVLSAEVTLPDQAVITMQSHISTKTIQEALSKKGDYTVSEDHNATDQHEMPGTAGGEWLQTYKPLLLVGGFITGVSLITGFENGRLSALLWMDHFMAGFFIVFSFFKLLDLRGFADSYATYDLLAKNARVYGYIYPFIELALGLAYLTGFDPVATNTATIVVMGFSSIGVIQSVLDKRKIRCACLGAVFNLPMSTVTIVEDLLMVAMAMLMLIIKTV